MQGHTNVSGRVSTLIAILVGPSGDSLCNMLVTCMSFDPSERDGVNSFASHSLNKVLPKVAIRHRAEKNFYSATTPDFIEK